MKHPLPTAESLSVGPAMELRNDVMRFEIRNDSLRQTDQGYWIVTIAAARTGLQTYVGNQYPGGSRVEFRSVEAVTESDSLTSWQHAPITIYHPDTGWVDLSNSPSLKRGYVFGCPRIELNAADGEYYLLVDVLLDHPEAIDGVRSGALKEASAGYACLFVAKPGEHRGSRYDGLQINIRINHLSLLPEGYARAGRYATIRTDDGRDLFYFALATGEPVLPAAPAALPPVPNTTPKGEFPAMESQPTILQRVRLTDQREINLPPDQAAEVQTTLDARDTTIRGLESQVQTLTDAQATLAGQITTLTDAQSSLQARADAAEGDVTRLTAELQQAKTDAAEAVKNALSDLGKTLVETLPHFTEGVTLDSLTDISARALHLEALKTLAPGVDFTTRDDAYVATFFDARKGTAPAAPTVDAVIGSGVPSASAQALYRGMQPGAAEPTTDQAPVGVSAYTAQLTATTKERGF